MISLMINKNVLLRVFESYFSNYLLAYTYDWDLNDLFIYLSLVFKGFFIAMYLHVYHFYEGVYIFVVIYIHGILISWSRTHVVEVGVEALEIVIEDIPTYETLEDG